MTIAAKNNGLTERRRRRSPSARSRAYREAMAQFAGMSTMDLWYAHLSEDDLRAAHRGNRPAQSRARAARSPRQSEHQGQRRRQDSARRKSSKELEAELPRAARQGDKNLRKAHTRDSLQALSKLGEVVDGRYRIVSQPPVRDPARESLLLSMACRWRSSRQPSSISSRPISRPCRIIWRRLLERFEIIDVARKVVGVGSVGTRAFIALLQGRDAQDPLFLQVKEATRSVLEDHLPKSRYRNPGERVVQGQRLMQAASDIFLGWTKGLEAGRFYYWRQLRDMKGSALVDTMSEPVLELYTRLCGWTLARAHARSGDSVAIAEYLGSDDAFDRAIADFSQRYADQNELDYQALAAAYSQRPRARSSRVSDRPTAVGADLTRR